MVQPLRAGVLFDSFDDIPQVHRPIRDVYEKGLPGADVQARKTPYNGSGTRWCATCHRTVVAGSRQKFCKPCTTERNKVRRIDLAATEFNIDAVTLTRLHYEADILQKRTQRYLNVRTGDDLVKTFEAFGAITEAGKILLSTIESLPKPAAPSRPM